jgi:hypothetical protein
MTTSDDEAVEAVRALVALGEYRDELPGLPGVALTSEPGSTGSRSSFLRRKPHSTKLKPCSAGRFHDCWPACT